MCWSSFIIYTIQRTVLSVGWILYFTCWAKRVKWATLYRNLLAMKSMCNTGQLYRHKCYVPLPPPSGGGYGNIASTNPETSKLNAIPCQPPAAINILGPLIWHDRFKLATILEVRKWVVQSAVCSVVHTQLKGTYGSHQIITELGAAGATKNHLTKGIFLGYRLTCNWKKEIWNKEERQSLLTGDESGSGTRCVKGTERTAASRLLFCTT